MPKKKSKERRLRCVYHFIVAHCLEHSGLPPTIRQICDGCHLSTTSLTHLYVQTLIKRGLLTAQAGKTRGIQVVGARWKPPEFCPQCNVPHAWGSVHNDWQNIVEECTNE